MLYRIVFWTEKGKMKEYAKIVDTMITYTDNPVMREKLLKISNFLLKLENLIGE